MHGAGGFALEKAAFIPGVTAAGGQRWQLLVQAFPERTPAITSRSDGFSLPVAQVAHFSKYGLQDSDEEEEEHPLKVDAKKLKTAPVAPPGLAPPQQMALDGKPTPPAQVEGGR